MILNINLNTFAAVQAAIKQGWVISKQVKQQIFTGQVIYIVRLSDYLTSNKEKYDVALNRVTSYFCFLYGKLIKRGPRVLRTGVLGPYNKGPVDKVAFFDKLK